MGNFPPRKSDRLLLITGAAGFIGMHTALQAVKAGYRVLGLDDLNDYYDVNLKLARLGQLGIHASDISDDHVVWGTKSIGFIKGGIEDKDLIEQIFHKNNIEHVIHLAAQGGVRNSIEHPEEYIKSNINGFFNALEACRHHNVKHLVYASSSSVYGMNETVPFKVTDNVDHPVSLYAATKKSNELMAHTYSHLFGLPTTGLRFFTVYGPWGRPDMAIYKFTERIIAGEPIDVYNHGKMSRDFTYIDDIVDGVLKILKLIPGHKESAEQSTDASVSQTPYRLCNIGRNEPVSLERFIKCIEVATGNKAIRNNLPMQPADVEQTFADVSQLKSLIGYSPKTNVDVGIKRFVEWYKSFHAEGDNSFSNGKPL